MAAVPAIAATVDVTIISSFEEDFDPVWPGVIVDIGEDVVELNMYVEEGVILELVSSVVKGVVPAINITLRNNQISLDNPTVLRLNIKYIINQLIKDGACNSHKSEAKPWHKEKLSETRQQRKIHYSELHTLKGKLGTTQHNT